MRSRNCWPVRIEQRRDAGRCGVRSEGGRASYIFNPTIAGIEQADALLIIGSNPRKEASVLNARIRKRWRSGALKVGLIGENPDLTYDYEHLGAGTETLTDLAAGKHSFADVLKNAKNPIVLVGAGVAARHDGAAVLALAAKLASGLRRGEGRLERLRGSAEGRVAGRRARHRLRAGRGYFDRGADDRSARSMCCSRWR
jgi:NADH dehydrogenase/NADH:ubiquinone oxidoreductase subunit G